MSVKTSMFDFDMIANAVGLKSSLYRVGSFNAAHGGFFDRNDWPLYKDFYTLIEEQGELNVSSLVTEGAAEYCKRLSIDV